MQPGHPLSQFRLKHQDIAHQLYQSYQFGMLSCHAISILDQSLELVVLCKSYDLQHRPKLGENLRKCERAQLGVI